MLTEYDYFIAVQIVNPNSYVELQEWHLPMQENPEEVLIEKDAFEKMSEEAKDLIHIILKTPTEFTEIFTPTGKVKEQAMYHILIHLKRKFGYQKAISIIGEIKLWLSNK